MLYSALLKWLSNSSVLFIMLYCITVYCILRFNKVLAKRCHTDLNAVKRGVWMEDGVASRTLQFSQAMKLIRGSSWYWGNMSWRDAEKVLISQLPGTYLVRDSASDRYIFTISYKTKNSVHHTRVAQHGGNFCLGGPNSLVKASSLISFIENSLQSCSKRRICMLMHSKSNGTGIEILELNHLLHRHELLPSLKYLCRVVIRNCVEKELLSSLPLPSNMICYLKDAKYFVPPNLQGEL